MIAFGNFLKAFHNDPNRNAYAWQERFADECVSGAPPSLVAVPTGCGKTTTVDALVWALGCQAARPPQERTVGVRIIWAIDRRILVDEVHEHARQLAKRLHAALTVTEDPLYEIANHLRSLSGGDYPLVVTRWRGALADRPALHPPTQAEVITSTLAQVGSRLLFRGYGIGPRSLSVGAGLVACDTTICLDEAHLAEPFRQTVEAVRAHRRQTETQLRLPGLALITLTATPPVGKDDAIRLNEEDRVALKRRLDAPKWARLLNTPNTEAERVKILAACVSRYLSDADTITVACVVNSVKRARAVFDALIRSFRDEEIDVLLLVGPQRPADREDLLTRHGDSLFGRQRPNRGLVCVATQTFEVGLDADVDAMVMDSASSSALVQRLGRLNRRGDRIGHATIVRDEESWLYQEDEARAWAWLQSRQRADGTVDVSVASLDADATRPAPSTLRSAPLLTPGVVELLAQTNPRPGPWQDPSIDPYLRGADDVAVLDVMVCWRVDLRPDVGDPAAKLYRETLLKLVPPQPEELLTLSVTAARALLAARFTRHGRATAAQALTIAEADVEGGAQLGNVPVPGPDEKAAPFMVLRRGDIRHGTLYKDRTGIQPWAPEPGDILVLPAEAGGVDAYGLAPDAKWTGAAEGVDVAGDRRQRRRNEVAPAPVRISSSALGIDANTDEGRGVWRRVRRRCHAVEQRLQTRRQAGAQLELWEFVLALHAELPDHPGLAFLAREASCGNPRWRLALHVVEPTDEQGGPLVDEQEIDELEGDDGRDDDDADDQGAGGLYRTWVLSVLPSGRAGHENGDGFMPPTLDAHAQAVARELESFCRVLDLPLEVSSTLSFAARVHDHGKADPRFQRFFRGGIAPLGDELIAKSVFGSDPRAARIARGLSGLPDELRHEALSVTIVAGDLAQAADADGMIDIDLLRHLVGAHHGIGRPILPVPQDGTVAYGFVVEAAGIAGTASGDVQDAWAEGEWLERFSRVLGRYGEWGVSYLEAILVLADRTVSARGE